MSLYSCALTVNFSLSIWKIPHWKLNFPCELFLLNSSVLLLAALDVHTIAGQWLLKRFTLSKQLRLEVTWRCRGARTYVSSHLPANCKCLTWPRSTESNSLRSQKYQFRYTSVGNSLNLNKINICRFCCWQWLYCRCRQYRCCRSDFTSGRATLRARRATFAIQVLVAWCCCSPCCCCYCETVFKCTYDFQPLRVCV